MEIEKQLLAMLEIIIKPKETLKNLPSDQFYIFGFLISAYFTFGNVLRNGTVQRISLALNSQIIAFVVTFILTGIVFVITAVITKGIVRLLGKRLTLNKVMNIIGYSQTPRLLISVPSSIILALLPERARLDVLSSVTKGGGFLGAVVTGITVLGFILLLYTIFLEVWGFIVSEGS